MLPDEMRELRAISEDIHGAFAQAGYGEVWTPTLEYEEVLERGDQRAAGAGFRMLDDHGRVLVLRFDMTIPIARLVASRFRDAPMPIRLCYFAHSYRAVGKGQIQSREYLQAGIELVGVAGPDGDAEVIALTVDALSKAGLMRHKIGVGDGSLYRTLLEDSGVGEEDRAALLETLTRRDLVGLEVALRRLGIEGERLKLLTTLPLQRGGLEVLDQLPGPVSAAADGLREIHSLAAERGVADCVIFDLGLVKELSYYTGAIFEVYDPAVGYVVGGGGRYDTLLGRFGRDLPACGMALDMERVHAAAAAEEALGL
ncbi:MAG: phosphoribosyltransferase regulatory subunit [Thermoleophilaceae bacterium]|jgi:ATP phosphoribosyltransferase regulatory subunit|nr:phosphoribosyltransferase regulatory subunit [Thermoleophilaceae bacterium]